MPTFVGVGAEVNTAAVPLPAGSVGDLLIVCWESDTNGDNPSIAGWSLSHKTTFGASNHIFGYFTRIADGTEGSSVTIGGTFTPATFTDSVAYRYSNVDPLAPINASGLDATTSTVSSLTSTIDGCTEFFCVTSDVGYNAGVTAPGGWTRRLDGSGKNDCGFDRAQAAAGVTGTTTTPADNGSTTNKGIVHLVIAPPSVARRAVGTTNHTASANSPASPLTVTGADITIQAGDTAVFANVIYAAVGAVTNTMTATVTCGGVAMTSVSLTKVVGFNGFDQDGWNECFVLQNPVTAIGSAGVKGISVTLTFSSAAGGIRCITIPVVVTGSIASITGNHVTSVNGATLMTSGALTVGPGGYAIALCGNGSTAPTVSVGTAVGAPITGTGNSGSDNACAADITANGSITFATNSADESQLSYVIVTAGSSGGVGGGGSATSVTRDRDRRAVRGITTRERLAVRGHDRQPRSQFELYRPASVFGNVALPRAISDAANGTDALTRSLVLARSVNDTAAGSDGLTRTLVQTRAITDTAAGSDAVVRTGVSTRAISDAAGGTDAVSRTLVQTRSISDSAPASDIAVVGALQRSINDTASGTDALTRTATFSRSLTDTAAGTDAAARTDVQVRAVTDSANGTDALTRTLIDTRSITDAAAGTDAITRTRVSTRSLTDSAPASDALTRSLAEPRTVTDTAAGSDAVARSAVYARSISDTAGGTDAVTRTRSSTRSISDSANGTDSVTTRTLVQARSISDSAPTAETIVSSKGPTRFINDNAPALDAITRTSTRTRALTEAVAGTDATTDVVSRTRSLSDAAGGTDALTRTLGESRSISDSAPASDATTRAPVIVRGIGDNAFASDTVTRTVRTNRAIGDSAPAVDSARKVLFVFITDQAGGTDAAVAIFVPTTVSIRVTRRTASFMGAMSPSGQRTAPRVQRTDEAS